MRRVRGTDGAQRMLRPSPTQRAVAGVDWVILEAFERAVARWSCEQKQKSPGMPGLSRVEIEIAGGDPGLPAAAAAAATAAAAAESAATTAAAESATTAAAAAFTGLGLVDGEVTAVDVLAVEGRDGGLRLGVVRHFDEAEAAGTTGLAIHDQRRGSDRAEGLEERVQLTFRSAEREITDVQFHLRLSKARETFETGAATRAKEERR